VGVVVAALQPVASAQKSEKAITRKLVYRVTPDYPWDLKRAHIGGTVRMDVVVSPHGSVDTISVIGGNPILTETAVKAVKKWKYAPADSESIVRINVDFDPNR
jgi:TonB family protein